MGSEIINLLVVKSESRRAGALGQIRARLCHWLTSEIRLKPRTAGPLAYRFAQVRWKHRAQASGLIEAVLGGLKSRTTRKAPVAEGT